MMEWKKKPVPGRAGPGFECLFIMHNLRKPVPPAAGPGFGRLVIMHGRILHVHGLRKPMLPAAGPGFGRAATRVGWAFNHKKRSRILRLAASRPGGLRIRN